MRITFEPTDCTVPEFRFDYQRRCWSLCVHCNAPAWSHPQADPMQDIRNHLRAALEHRDMAEFPPTMRSDR